MRRHFGRKAWRVEWIDFRKSEYSNPLAFPQVTHSINIMPAKKAFRMCWWLKRNPMRTAWNIDLHAQDDSFVEDSARIRWQWSPQLRWVDLREGMAWHGMKRKGEQGARLSQPLRLHL
jgi:hypothetical protein